MQEEDELNKLYQVLDGNVTEEVAQDKYLKSVKRRLNKESLISTFHEDVSKDGREKIELPKPRVNIVLPKISKTSRKEVKKKSVEKKNVEDLIEIEKIDPLEIKEILERKKMKREEVEHDREIIYDESRESFVKTVSRIRGIGEKRAQMLYDSGYTSLEKIAGAKPREISKNVKGISPNLARRLKRDVKRMLEREEKDIPEWEVVEKTEPYRYEDFTLYLIEKRGKIKYVFSKKPPRGGKPCQIPPGYVVKINRKGKPSLEKVK